MPDDCRVPEAGQSYVRGSTDEPLSEATVHALLCATAARWPQREAVVFREQGARLSWYALAEEAEVVAAGLWALGLRRGDRVAIWSPNRVEWLITQFATARIGAILVGINPAYRLPELEYALRNTGVSVLLTAAFKTSGDLGVPKGLGVWLKESAASLPALRTVVHMGEGPIAGTHSWAKLMTLGRAQLGALPPEGVLGCNDPINIQFTSGTTGPPKPVTLTHRSIVNNALAVSRRMRLSEADVLCAPVPLHHCFGMVLSVLACVASGAKLVVPGEDFDPVAT